MIKACLTISFQKRYCAKFSGLKTTIDEGRFLFALIQPRG